MAYGTKTNIVLIVVLLCMLVSCVSDNENTKQPTCENFEFWDGICPGRTSLDEAIALLEEKYGQRNVTVDLRYNSISWKSDKPDDRFLGGGTLRTNEQGIIGSVSLSFDQLAVEELIAQLGTPAFVHVAMAWSSDYPCAGAIIRYPDRGVLAYPNQEYGSNTIGIVPAQEIQGLTILPPDETKDWFMYDTVAVEWQGYIDYCKLAFPDKFEGNG